MAAALSEKINTDDMPRVIEGKKATSITLNGDTFSFTPEGKTMVMRGFDIVQPQDVSIRLQEVAQKLMKERGIAPLQNEIVAAPANAFANLIPKELPIERFNVSDSITVKSPIISAAMPPATPRSLG